MDEIICGETTQYEVHADSRKDYPTLTVESSIMYSNENNELYLDASGPSGGDYVLIFDLSNEILRHDHGKYGENKAKGKVEDIRFSD